jgi:hypothetical protein
VVGLSDIKLDWVDGVSGDDAHEAALPPGNRIDLSSTLLVAREAGGLI